MFDDQYLSRGDNAQLLSAIMSLLARDHPLIPVDRDRPEYNDPQQTPDIEALSERLRSCLQDSEEIPVDFTQLFDLSLSRFDLSLVPEVIKLYEVCVVVFVICVHSFLVPQRLCVKREPLNLIPPQFEVPLPQLQPAIYMPSFRDMPPPPLELFDLDSAFSSEKHQLAQLTNKCTDDDLEYYLREAGEVLGVSEAIRQQRAASGAEAGKVTANAVLSFLVSKIVNYKRLDQDGDLNLGVHSSNFNPLSSSSSNAAADVMAFDE